MTHETDALAQALKEKIQYPASIMGYIDRGILGDGFYPGARGTLTPAFPYDQVILLGRDFGSKADYDPLCNIPGQSETSKTWERTKLTYLDILPREKIWLTNYLLGVRVKRPTTGNAKERIIEAGQHLWEKYEASCWTFLLTQISLQRPKLIVVFGKDNLNDLSKNGRIDSYRSTVSPDGRGSICRHRFLLNDGLQHDADVYFADHPFSSIGPERIKFVRAQATFSLSRLSSLDPN